MNNLLAGAVGLLDGVMLLSLISACWSELAVCAVRAFGSGSVSCSSMPGLVFCLVMPV